MKACYDFNGVTLYQGDSAEVLKALPDASVHCVITSPPYFALRSYLPADHADKGREIGLEASPAAHLEALLRVFRECYRVLRPDGVMWVNYGDSYACSSNGRSAADTKAAGNDNRTFRDKPFDSSGFLPEKNLLGMPWRLAFALQESGWILRSALPWFKVNCLSGGTRVYARTQKGEMPMTIKDMVRLKPETVQLWNGEKWTQVIAFWQNERPDCPLELELRSGERIGCTPDHVWPTCRGNVKASDLQIGDIIRTCALPEKETPDRPGQLPDEMIGWFIGLYLAEGNKNGDYGMAISGHIKEDERLRRCQEIAAAYDGTCRIRKHHANGAVITIESRILRAVLDTYITGSDAKTKHLTTAAWQRTNEFLRSVLVGYLSGDGHFDGKNLRWRLGFTSNDAWASDLRTIAARLGYRIKLTRYNHPFNGGLYPGWKGEIRLVERANVPGGFPVKNLGEIVAIRASRARQFWDIAVADEPHLFALASGVLTHNCMPESCRDRPTTAHEYVFLFTKQARYWYDGDAVRRPVREVSLKRAEYGIHIQREAGQGQAIDTPKMGERFVNPAGRNFRTSDAYPLALQDQLEAVDAELERLTLLRCHLEKLTTARGLLTDPDGEPLALNLVSEPTKESHFAAFGTNLVKPLLLSGCPETVCAKCGAGYVREILAERRPNQNTCNSTYPTARGVSGGVGNDRRNREDRGFSASCGCAGGTAPGVVLDPFLGTGTVAYVARALGRRAIGIELSSEYLEIARRRLGQGSLFLAAAEAETA